MLPAADRRTLDDVPQRETLVTAQPYAQLDWQALSALRLTVGVKGAVFDRAVAALVMEGTRLSEAFERDFAAALPSATALEAEATQAVPGGVSLYGGGSLNQPRQSAGSGATGGSAPATPQATISSGVLYQRQGLQASLVDRWVGGAYGDVGRMQWIAPFNQLDLSVGTIVDRVTVRGQVFNLLDSRKVDGLAGYTVAAGTPLFWTQPGLSVFVSATAWF